MKLTVEPEESMEQVGKELLKPPVEVEPLLDLLGRAEALLTKVEQSPQPAMIKALEPLMNSLVSNGLLRHQNTDVKVAVASCISEITRITAPEAPYDDDLMKVIFELIVEVFAGLSDTTQSNQISYNRRISILETVAKVRSCVVMLDLECDELILQMFRHFFRAPRVSHPDSAYSLMETIMTVVIEESEDFSPDFISCLLESVKKGNTDLTRELGETVIGKCASKLKQYLLKEIQSNGLPLSEYSRIVATVCDKVSDAPASKELNACGRDDGKLSERTVSDEHQQGSTKMDSGAVDVAVGRDKSLDAVTSNGITVLAKEALADPSSTAQADPFPDHVTKDADALVSGKGDKIDFPKADSLKADKLSRQNAKKSKNRKDRVLSAEMSDRSPMDIEKNVVASNHKEEQNSQSVAFDKKMEADAIIDEAGAVENSNEKTVVSKPKRGRPPGVKNSVKKGKHDSIVETSTKKGDDESLGSPSPSKKASNKTLRVVSSSRQNPMKSIGNDDYDASSDDLKISQDGDIKKGDKPDTEVKSSGQLRKEVDKPDDMLHNESKVRKRRGRKSGIHSEKHNTEKEGPSVATQLPETPTKNDYEKDLGASEEAIVKKSRRKRDQELKEDSDGSDERLVGSHIKVWWPDDKKFYPGIIESYDPMTKKHKVLYADGDVENLVLKDERWRFLSSEKSTKSGQTENDDSLSTPAKKKAKINSDLSNKMKGDKEGIRGSSSAKSDAKHGDSQTAELADSDADQPEVNKQEKHGVSFAKHTSANSGKKERLKSKAVNPDLFEGGTGKDRTPKSVNYIMDKLVSKSAKKLKVADAEDDFKAKEVDSTFNKSVKKNMFENSKDSEGSEVRRKNKGFGTPKSVTKSLKEKSSKVEGSDDHTPQSSEGPRKRGRSVKS